MSDLRNFGAYKFSNEGAIKNLPFSAKIKQKLFTVELLASFK